MDKAREENLAWTNYVKLIERYLYLGESEPVDDNITKEKVVQETTDPKEKPKDPASQEPSLFE
jgi:hypothetical protein